MLLLQSGLVSKVLQSGRPGATLFQMPLTSLLCSTPGSLDLVTSWFASFFCSNSPFLRNNVWGVPCILKMSLFYLLLDNVNEKEF